MPLFFTRHDFQFTPQKASIFIPNPRSKSIMMSTVEELVKARGMTGCHNNHIAYTRVSNSPSPPLFLSDPFQTWSLPL